MSIEEIQHDQRFAHTTPTTAEQSSALEHRPTPTVAQTETVIMNRRSRVSPEVSPVRIDPAIFLRRFTAEALQSGALTLEEGLACMRFIDAADTSDDRGEVGGIRKGISRFLSGLFSRRNQI